MTILPTPPIRTALALAAVSLGLATFPQAQAADFVLVSARQPKTRIVVDKAETAAPTLFAVEELGRYVKEMSGATLPVVHELTNEPSIVISTDPKRAPSKEGAAWKPQNEDQYLLEVQGKRLSIVGATPRATLYGVYDLLERLGCSWCVPGDDTVPKRDTLSVAAMRLDTAPVFEYRMTLDFPLMSVNQSIAIADWIAKNRMNWIHPCANAHGEPKDWYDRRAKVIPEIQKRGLHVIFGGHTMHTWVPETEFKDHPDWFAYNDGKREAPTLCLSNSEMTAELVKNMRHFLDACPETEVIDLWHPDGDVFCHCPQCTRGLVPESAKGVKPESTPADAVQAAYVISYVEFLNRVAGEIGKSHPKVMIGPLTYRASDRAMPDGCPPLADNLLPGLAHIFRDSYRPLAGEPKSAANMRFLGNDITWMAKAKHHFVYEYYCCWAPPFIYPGARVIVRDLQLLRDVGSQGVCSDTNGWSPINMYVAARALWSPDVAWEPLVRDFNVRYYGEAGKKMADNWVGLEKGIYGIPGYQANGALDNSWSWVDNACGQWLKQQRPAQVAFLEGLIERTKDPMTKTRLTRALKPWKMWSEEPRWWALPDFAP